MRHKKNMVKLGRTAEARRALLSSMVSNLIEEQRVKTTVVKARQTKILAEKMVTVAKKALSSASPTALMDGKRKALSVLRHRKHVQKLFEGIAPQYKDRAGGYTRIVKLGRRASDSSEMVYLEWVDLAPTGRRKKAAADEAVSAPTADAKTAE